MLPVDPSKRSPNAAAYLSTGVRTGLLLGLAAALSLACAIEPADDPQADQGAAATTATIADENAPLLVTDPRILIALEEKGLSLSKFLGVDGTSGEALVLSRTYSQIADAIANDIRAQAKADPQSGIGFDFLHRQFDPEWLRSPQARFELIGVVNRTDLRERGNCGEYRLVYRLAYTASRSESRLPMTMSLVFRQTDDGAGCATVAQRWLGAKNATVEALVDGPLKRRGPIGWIDINLQSVRWPSNARTDFGGHAEYLLRSFLVAGDTAVPRTLENTPRSDLDPAERDELRGWIREHLDAIDDGSAVIPKKFLATSARAVGPLGTTRLANRPFSQLFPEADTSFGDMPLGGTKQLASVPALMRRLDTMTCQGCHQARSIAGFHLLGEERDDESRLNALAVGRSPHLVDELAWRTDRLNAIANQAPHAAPLPFAEHGSDSGRYGAHCGLGDPGFRSWTCAADLACTDLNGDVVGICSPKTAHVGDACATGRVTLTSDPRKDTVSEPKTLACDPGGESARCNPVKLGFPDGLCRTDCTEAESGSVVGKTICGGIPSASGLTKCLTVLRLPFKECLAQSNPTFLRTCDANEPCRDDYACVRVKGGPQAVGACMPPYFAFQARVDGHILDR